ncbi:27640_t:CDS:2 [Gigaspora margarita]|uniref:ATP-dependent DNA helicase n=1 Tax=Gigaspora margarita TaxID=4874 RepID=A0ABN7UR17_GIGMA|nr:27640_t:CDS:2 [Gigaspora margarita]
MSSQFCKKCDSFDHKTIFCTKTTCNACGNTGHISAYCPTLSCDICKEFSHTRKTCNKRFNYVRLVNRCKKLLKKNPGDSLYYPNNGTFPSFRDVYNVLNIKLFNSCKICWTIINRPKEFCNNCEIIVSLNEIKEEDNVIKCIQDNCSFSYQNKLDKELFLYYNKKYSDVHDTFKNLFSNPVNYHYNKLYFDKLGYRQYRDRMKRYINDLEVQRREYNINIKSLKKELKDVQEKARKHEKDLNNKRIQVQDFQKENRILQEKLIEKEKIIEEMKIEIENNKMNIPKDDDGIKNENIEDLINNEVKNNDIEVLLENDGGEKMENFKFDIKNHNYIYDLTGGINIDYNYETNSINNLYNSTYNLEGNLLLNIPSELNNNDIGVIDRTKEEIILKIKNLHFLSKRIINTKVLIIDKISMLSCNAFDLINEVLQEICGNVKPFGGIIDFFVEENNMLKCVNCEAIFYRRDVGDLRRHFKNSYTRLRILEFKSEDWYVALSSVSQDNKDLPSHKQMMKYLERKNLADKILCLKVCAKIDDQIYGRKGIEILNFLKEQNLDPVIKFENLNEEIIVK